MRRAALLPGILLTLLLPTGAARAQDGPEQPAQPSPRLGLERVFGGPPIHAPLPGWSWRPGQAELVRVEGSKDDERLVALDPVGGGSRALLSLSPLAGLVEAPGAGEESLGRGGPARLLWTRDGQGLCALVQGERVWVSLSGGAPRVLTRGIGRRSDVQISPDGAHLSFVTAEAFVVLPTDGGPALRWPHDGPDAQRGRLDWLYPEELGLTHGAWWAPDGRSLAVLTLDQTGVPAARIQDRADASGEGRLMRYPRPGEQNPRPRVQVLPLGDGPPRPPIDVDLGPHEYVVRVIWTPDARALLVATLDRAQRHLTLWAADPQSGTSRVLLEERDEAWIEPPPEPRFLGERTLLWRTAWGVWTAHELDRRDPGKRISSRWLVPPPFVDGPLLAARRVPTVGPGTEPQRLEALVAGVRPGDRRRTVWSVALPGGEGPWLAGVEDDLEVEVDDTQTLALVRRSTALSPPVLELRRVADGGLVRTLGQARTAAYDALELPELEEGSTETEGGRVLWRLWRPRALAEGERRPLVVLVYGGPGSRTVEDRFGGGPYWPALLVQRGFLVLQADGRGTGGQGQAFERAVRGRLGLLELEDQVRAVRAVSSRPYVDGARVGIYGWSYGGTMAALALTRRGDVFRAGVAVAPVTDWRLYDTIYTERYMGLPAGNEAGYEGSSVVAGAKGLSGELLVIHGLGDDNVHPENTLRLVDALLAAKKTGFEWLLYPRRGHGIGGAGRDVHARALAWFERTLLGR